METRGDWMMVDLYGGEQRRVREDNRKKYPRGASALVKAVTEAVISGDGVPANGLAQSYKRAEHGAECLKDKGEKDRADLIRQQYMEERFLPAIETVIRYSSPDELLNCKEALRALDKYALGVGDKNGYTAAYVRSAYADQLGEDLNDRFGRSDPTVTDAVRRIVFLSAKDEIRAAIGVAKQIKKAIDSGDNMASDDDYEIIGRVVAYGD